MALAVSVPPAAVAACACTLGTCSSAAHASEVAIANHRRERVLEGMALGPGDVIVDPAYAVI
jgi:hypothetical protein